MTARFPSGESRPVVLLKSLRPAYPWSRAMAAQVGNQLSHSFENQAGGGVHSIADSLV
jgi:hypothetical protein